MRSPRGADKDTPEVLPKDEAHGMASNWSDKAVLESLEMNLQISFSSSSILRHRLEVVLK